MQYKGYAIKDTKKYTDFEVIDFKPKPFTEDDVEIAITHCGVCGSDVHTITGGWGPPELPLIVGHEIVGKVTRVGANVKDVKVGQRAGVGAQCFSCLKCRACKDDNENYCPDMVDTYNAKLPDGTKTQGGYSTGIIAHTQFVFPIPDEVESKHACSMLCAGLTVFSPLIRNGAGPGKKVGVVGLGGLGHYAVLFAKALGAEVFVFSHSPSKEVDAKKLGADHYISTGKPDFAKSYAGALDLIISTRDVAKDMPLQDYLTMLYVHGSFITVGIPDDPLPELKSFDFLANGCKLGGSHIGSKKEALQMLDIAAKKGIKPWIEELPMKDVAKAIQGVKDNKVRYRYVLTQDLA
ncbi:GroES-like protein [Sistotremastrum niveocremeum HHB9708]|uniref:alcohol dehydrogenase (NADP(+)) n=2 Tax=Sistotremastraceae TaxID=3402574 RepID=A0A164PS19_9AGAM|nr:GroES-like protein [Sistotremastrum niveocremeum HHB9708]KZT37548.1 GroES-like protein [Sistotremastrum suecicum HHB10207 ss-3]